MKFRGCNRLCMIALCAAAGLPGLVWADAPSVVRQDQPVPPGMRRLTLDAQATTAPVDAVPAPLHQTSTPVLRLDAAPATGAAEGESEADLAKDLQNPVAALISVPLQYNMDLGIGPKNTKRQTLNVQPVIPFTLNEDWNLIMRTIVPVIYADSPATGTPYEFGLGDVVQSFFFSPRKPVGGWILGAGPVFLWPSATDDLLGSQKFGAGPTALALQQQGGWTYGILANHLWSYAGEGSRQEVNATFLQPFISYTFPTYTTVGLNTESTYDWRHEQWTVPINLSVSQLVKFGSMPVQFSLGGRGYAEGPTGGPDWGVRFVVTFLFPK